MASRYAGPQFATRLPARVLIRGPLLTAAPTDLGSLRPGLVLESSTPVRPVAKGLSPGIAASAQVLVPFNGKFVAVGVLQLNRADNLVRAVVVDVDCNVCHLALHPVSCRLLSPQLTTNWPCRKRPRVVTYDQPHKLSPSEAEESSLAASPQTRYECGAMPLPPGVATLTPVTLIKDCRSRRRSEKDCR